jgi:hypothetical protein
MATCNGANLWLFEIIEKLFGKNGINLLVLGILDPAMFI